MRKLTTLGICFFLAACGGSNTTEQQVNSPSEQQSTTPTQLSERPTVEFDNQLLTDVQSFLELSHKVQYFYPSEAVERSDWIKFNAETIVLLSQTAPADRLEVGLQQIQSIAPFVTHNESALPEIAANTSVNIWRQDAAVQQDVHNRALISGAYGQLSQANKTAVDTEYQFTYNGQALFMPLAVPIDNSTQGVMYNQAQHFSLTSEFTAPENCMAVMSTMWGEIQHFWPYFEQINIDWSQSHMPILSACAIDDPLSRVRALHTEFTKLEDNHIIINYPQNYINTTRFAAPFFLIEAQGKAVVVGLNDSIASQVELGDVITHLDGNNINTYITPLANRSLKSQKQRRDIAIRNLHLLEKNKAYTADFTKPNGDRYHIEFTPSPLDAASLTTIFNTIPRAETALEDLGNGIYKVNAYMLPSSSSALGDIKTTLSNAKGIVIDFRHYPENTQYLTLTRWFLSNPSRISTYFSHWQRAPEQSNTYEELHSQTIQPDSNPITAPVVVMASRFSQSQNEHALSFFKVAGIPVLGEATSGINGNIVERHYLESAEAGPIRFVYTGLRANRFNGEKLIGVGVVPDIHIPITPESIRNQEDVQLSAAIEYVSSQ